MLRSSHGAAAAGFSLVELLAGVAVLGIVAAIAAPAMRELLHNNRAMAAQHALVAHMHLARSSAVSAGRTAVLCPSRDGRRCSGGSDWAMAWLIFLDRDGNGRPDAPTDIIRAEPQPAPRQLRIRSSSGRHALRYMADGRSAGTNLTVSICNSKGALHSRVIVSNSGRVRSEKAAAGIPCSG